MLMLLPRIECQSQYEERFEYSKRCEHGCRNKSSLGMKVVMARVGKRTK